MAGYKVVSRIKDSDEETGYIERGQSVKKSDFETKDWEEMVAGGSVVTDREFNALFPNYGLDEDQPEEEEAKATPPAGQQNSRQGSSSS